MTKPFSVHNGLKMIYCG